MSSDISRFPTLKLSSSEMHKVAKSPSISTSAIVNNFIRRDDSFELCPPIYDDSSRIFGSKNAYKKKTNLCLHINNQQDDIEEQSPYIKGLMLDENCNDTLDFPLPYSYGCDQTLSSQTSPYKLICIDDIKELPNKYPDEFIEFCEQHSLTPPKITTGNGRALSVMLEYPMQYWDRKSCDEFVTKFSIQTRDSIQLFNKHSQWGIATNSGKERGKLYIKYPYQLSNKYKMRKNFKYDGTESEKNAEIDHIKSTIQCDYIDPPYDKWQLGHKNPGSIDNSNENMVLQPPIQGKYRDDYLFFDTLTKMPLPKKLKKMLGNKEIELTTTQIKEYLELFGELLKQSAQTNH